MKSKTVTKLLVSIVILFIIGTSITPVAEAVYKKNIPAFSTKQEPLGKYAYTSQNVLNADAEDSYLIEGVPYVGQNRYSCGYASLTMILQYFGHNVTLEDFLHHSGIGYSIAFFNFRIPGLIVGTPMSGAGLAQNPSNIKYIASLYGLIPIDFSNLLPSLKKQEWNEYWTKIKNYIKQDIPVMTSVDPYSLPFYIENDLLPKEYDHAGHAVVVIGFNESNNTVCVNDPGTSLFNESEEGMYVHLSKNVFKGAVENTTASKYVILAFEQDYTKPVLTEGEIFEICHKKNIERMEGKIGAYIGTSTSVTLPMLGINALKKYKKSLKNPLLRFILIKNLCKINPRILNHSLNFMTLEKQTISKYLLEKENLSSFCEYDAFLLGQEAECCKKLHQYNLELYKICKNNNILKAMFLSNNLIKKMIEEIDRMITFEQAIINGPAE